MGGRANAGGIRGGGRHGQGLEELVLSSFLDCGILAKGFARVHCTRCGKDALVAFSCKGRGFCPSCGARRMADTTALRDPSQGQKGLGSNVEVLQL